MELEQGLRCCYVCRAVDDGSGDVDIQEFSAVCAEVGGLPPPPRPYVPPLLDRSSSWASATVEPLLSRQLAASSLCASHLHDATPPSMTRLVLCSAKAQALLRWSKHTIPSAFASS